jgi:hypothetical protein
MYSIARNNFCRPFYPDEGVVQLIGAEHNVTIVKGMYEYLAKAIERLRNQGWKDYSSNYYSKPPVNDRKWKASFCMGAVATINSRLRNLRLEQQGELSEEENALVVNVEAALETAAYVYKYGVLPPTEEEMEARRVASEAYWKKYEADQAAKVASGEIIVKKPKKSYYQRKDPKPRFDSNAYSSGASAARSINLDRQVK